MANTTSKSNQADPVMREVAGYVAANPGCPELWPATFTGPGDSARDGHRAVARALAAGLIEDRSGGARRRLYVTAAGLAVQR